jgi:long-chain acyl-CoA synthetase
MTLVDTTVELLGPAEAEARQRAAAGWLAAAGCRAGDRVAFSLGSSADLLCAVLGALRTGVVPVLLNATLVPAERALLVADAEPVVTVQDRGRLAEMVAGPPAELAPRPLTRPMHYTSGTTGRPKGVSVGVWDEGTAAAVFDDEAALWSFGPDDRHLVCSPTYHTVSVRFAAGTLLSGGSLAILPRFSGAAALEVLRSWRPTTTFMAPTHLQRVLAQPELGEDERFASLRLLVHAGSSCPPALKRSAMSRVPAGALWEFYGSTEGQFTVCGPEEWLAHPGTVGRARPGRSITVRDEDRGALPEGEVGTIWCRPPAFARFSYWRNPGATEAAWCDGAFTVGDLGHLNDEGYLYLSGRRDDLIISGGVNVYPAEVEAALAEVPGVHEAAVFGQADPEWGQRVCAAVVGDPGLTEEALAAAAAARLAPYKRPKQYLVVGSLPHTATGKLLRRAVAAHLGLEPGVPGGF